MKMNQFWSCENNITVHFKMLIEKKIMAEDLLLLFLWEITTFIFQYGSP